MGVGVWGWGEGGVASGDTPIVYFIVLSYNLPYLRVVFTNPNFSITSLLNVTVQLQGWSVWGIVKNEKPQEFSPKTEKPHSKIWEKNETAMINNDAVISLSFSLLSCQLGSIKLK